MTTKLNQENGTIFFDLVKENIQLMKALSVLLVILLIFNMIEYITACSQPKPTVRVSKIHEEKNLDLYEFEIDKCQYVAASIDNRISFIHKKNCENCKPDFE